jgi:hypothetical protein
MRARGNSKIKRKKKCVGCTFFSKNFGCLNELFDASAITFWKLRF